jgi:hypothetical protein
MIATIANFGEKSAFFLKTNNVMIIFSAKIAVISVKIAKLLSNHWQKYFKNRPPVPITETLAYGDRAMCSARLYITLKEKKTRQFFMLNKR